MKHFKHLIILMLIALGGCPSMAQTQTHEEPYDLDLNTSISTSGAFKMAPGWQHILGTSTVYYTYNRYNGYGSSGWLYATSQGSNNDLLVTPELTGEVSMLVKVYNSSYVNSASIRFFSVSEDRDGNLEVGQELESVLEFIEEPAEPADPALSASEFMVVKLAQPLSRPTMIGIRLEYVGIDNFHADAADLTLRPALSFYSASLNTTKPEVTPDGMYDLTFTLRVRNSGEVELNPGDDGYEVELYANSDDELLGVFPIDQTLAVGATSQNITLTATLDYRQYPNAEQFWVKENITGNEYSVSGTSTPVPYEYDFGLANASTGAKMGTELNFGIVRGAKSIALTAYNDGTAPVTINSVEVTGGFSVDGITNGMAIAGKTEQNFTISTPAGGAGEYNGQLTLNYGDNESVTLLLSVNIMDESKWFEDFEGGQLPANMTFTTTSTYSHYWKLGTMYANYMEGNNYVLYTSNGYNDEMADSPLLEFTEGEQLSFMAARYNSSAADLRISYSTDRSTWTPLLTLSTASEDETTLLPADYLGSSYYYQLKTFNVNMPAGRYYVRFTSKRIVIDNIYGGKEIVLEHDAQLTNASFDAEGMMNHAMQAGVTVKNNNTKAETADSYSVKLYVDGVAVAEAESVEIPAKGSQVFNFSYTPHKTGSHTAYFVFEAGDYVLQTEEMAFNVAEEVSTDYVTVGNPTTSTNYAPVWVNYEYNESEIIYTASQLGIEPGSKITEIVYRGYSTANGTVTSHIKAWIENTEDVSVASSDGIKATTGMTQIFDGDVTFNRVGSSSNHVDLIVIKLDEPFVYEGNSLRLSFHAESSNYKQVYFSAQSLSGQCIYRGVSNPNQLSTKTPSNCYYLPVAYISVEKEPTQLAGFVTDMNDNPLPGVTVEAVSNDVVYSGKTDDEGAYGFTVVQDKLTYDINVSVAGYEAQTISGVTFDGSLTQNVSLVLAAREFEAGQVYTVCLPFALDEAAVAEAGEMYALKGLEDGKIVFSQVAATEAYVPYLFIAEQGDAIFDNFDPESITADGQTVTKGDVSFVGTMTRQHLFAQPNTTYYGYSGNSFGAFQSAYISPMRAYLVVEGNGAKSMAVSFENEPTPTGIVDNLIEKRGERKEERGYCFDLQGRLVNNSLTSHPSPLTPHLKKGIYIINGKKVVIK